MRVAIVGDTHGNGPAFEAILDRIGDVDRVFGLGDWLFPSAGSYRIADWVRDCDGAFVRGNHDEWENAKQFRDHWQSDPTDIMRAMADLPPEREVSVAGHDVKLIHGYPVHPDFSVSDDRWLPQPPEDSLRLYRREYVEHYVDTSDVDVLLWGDLHLPYVEVHEDLVLANPGAAGLSIDQLLQHVSFMIAEFESDYISIEHHRVPVSVADVVADVGEEYAEGDPTGSWLVSALCGKPRVQTRDWKTHWGTVEIRRAASGYETDGPLWDLAAETAPPDL